MSNEHEQRALARSIETSNKLDALEVLDRAGGRRVFDPDLKADRYVESSRSVAQGVIFAALQDEHAEISNMLRALVEKARTKPFPSILRDVMDFANDLVNQ